MKDLARYGGCALGAVLGIYCGAAVLIPVAGVFIFTLIAKRLPMPRLKPFIGAIAIQFGLGLSMFVGGMYYYNSGGMRVVMLDLIVLAVGLIWLMARPSLIPVLFLGIYELIVVVINIDRISGYQVGSVFHKSLTMIIALRLAAIISLIVGYRQFRKNETEAAKTELEKARPDAA